MSLSFSDLILERPHPVRFPVRSKHKLIITIAGKKKKPDVVYALQCRLY